MRIASHVAVASHDLGHFGVSLEGSLRVAMPAEVRCENLK